ncbi:UNVERIFIED_CONTAM: hypothetical protein GTU68_010972 [Idotea baltica]|nr:hypothetical protein [Idotea baltica]
MSTVHSALIDTVLIKLKPWQHLKKWYIALSGGLDSSVLLHILATHPQRNDFPLIVAVHVNHNLQQVAQAWPVHCQLLCDQYNIPLHIHSVKVPSEASLENAARQARYELFDSLINKNEAVLSAHHSNDQFETVLFRLLRGSGLHGLTGIPSTRSLGRGMMLRPLLNISKVKLECYARRHNLLWVEDPSNQDLTLSRNYLRHQIIPQLLERWPRAIETATRNVQHLIQASDLLDEIAQQDLLSAQENTCWSWLSIAHLSFKSLNRLTESRQINVLRYWLRQFTHMPDTAHWAGWTSLRNAESSAMPVWSFSNGDVYRTAGYIWWVESCWGRNFKNNDFCLLVKGNQKIILPNNGVLEIKGILPEGEWTVGYRREGEKIYQPSVGHKSVKKLLNERNVPVFLRSRLPMLRQNNQLRAIAGIHSFDRSTASEWSISWIPFDLR